MGVGEATVKRANVVQNKGSPELVEAMTAGTMTVNGAYNALNTGNDPPKTDVDYSPWTDKNWPSCIPRNLVDVKLSKKHLSLIDQVKRHFKNRREQRILVTVLEETWSWMKRQS
jgi:hypothetical protein